VPYDCRCSLMNLYTKEELTEFIKDFTTCNTIGSSISITCGNANFLVTEQLFISVVFLDPILDPLSFMSNGNESEIQELLKIRKFIYEVPLHKVPLYIRVYDTIVAWRLRIGK
jgi:hypothetical protein